MDTLRQDMQFTLRSLRKRPGFAAVAIATLALGIGMNTGMFSIVRAVLLDALPYAEPDRLVRVHGVNPDGGIDHGVYSPLDFEDLASDATSFSRTAAFFHAPGLSHIALTGSGEAALLESAYVSSDFFGLLGVSPHVGRLPTDEEMKEGSDRVAVLSYDEWQTRFGGARDVVGSTVTMRGLPFTIIGVMPHSFAYPSAAVRAWVPLSLITENLIPRRRGVRYLGVIAQLAPNVARDAAEIEATSIASRLAESYPDTNRGWTAARVNPLRDELLGSVRQPLLVLSIAVGLVLLIACANMLNLLLARSSSRMNEFAVRTALGAGRARIFRQLVTESMVLALIGGALGLLAATWLVSAVTGMTGMQLPRADDVRIDGVVAAFAFGLSLLTGVLTGGLPALRSAHTQASTLREGGRSGSDGVRRQRLRGALVSAEMALAVLLVIGAGLMLRSLDTLLRVEPGFETDNLLAVSLQVPNSRATSLEQSVVYRNEIQQRLAALPGVSSVAISRTLPLEQGGEAIEFVTPSGDKFRAEAGTLMVSSEYFATLGIPILRGRAFDDRERRNADGTGREWTHQSIIINALTARAIFGDEDPVGQRLLLALEGYEGIPFEIVGVVGDVRHMGLHRSPPTTMYVSIDQTPRLTLRFILRTETSPAAFTNAARDAIRGLEPDQPIAEIVPLSETIGRAAARERFISLLLSGFAALALLLAAIGIYGVVAYGVAQRMHEMGIRIALGALPSRVVRMIVAESAVWWGSGLVIGLALAAVAVRLLRSLVYGVSVHDGVTFASVALLLAATALLASLAPAFRASRADPTSAFR
jgi:predicted permease